jgi:hypothetical protein
MSRLSHQRIRLEENNDLTESLREIDLILCADRRSERTGKSGKEDNKPINDENLVENGIRRGTIQVANEIILEFAGYDRTHEDDYAAFQLKEYQRQLYNRTTLLEDMRKSYLRDVVVLKNLMKVLLIISPAHFASSNMFVLIGRILKISFFD